jgi:hypothetical protein
VGGPGCEELLQWISGMMAGQKNKRGAFGEEKGLYFYFNRIIRKRKQKSSNSMVSIIISLA